MTAEPKRDRYGRYLAPDPTTGVERAYTRVSTLIDALDDKTNLTNWKLRHACLGLAKRPDLIALTQAIGDPDTNKRDLDRIASDALAASGMDAKANLGTALHSLSEMVDLDTMGLEDIPLPHRHDIAAYRQALDEAGITVLEGFVERVVVIPELDVMGTIDRIYVLPDGRLVVGDLKTGRVDYGALKFAAQQGAYVGATHWMDPIKQSWQRMPDVDPNIALIVHMPAGQGECTIYEVDAKRGYEYCEAALQVREGRKDKTLMRPFGEPKKPAETKPTETLELTQQDERDDPAHPMYLFDERREYALRRVKYVISNGGGDRLKVLWAQSFSDLPTFRQGGPRNVTEIDQVLGLCSLVEMELQMQFPDFSDPAKEKQVTKK